MNINQSDLTGWENDSTQSCPREVVLFLKNFGKCCSICFWKLPKIFERLWFSPKHQGELQYLKWYRWTLDEVRVFLRRRPKNEDLRPCGLKRRPTGLKRRPPELKRRPLGLKRRLLGLKRRPFGLNEDPLD